MWPRRMLLRLEHYARHNPKLRPVLLDLLCRFSDVEQSIRLAVRRLWEEEEYGGLQMAATRIGTMSGVTVIRLIKN